MGKRMLFSVMGIFAFTFAPVFELSLDAHADIPMQCECCQVGELKGTYRKILGTDDYECRCNGCGYGSLIYNPYECVLECENMP